MAGNQWAVTRQPAASAASAMLRLLSTYLGVGDPAQYARSMDDFVLGLGVRQPCLKSCA
jgi:hypothetical protein